MERFRPPDWNGRHNTSIQTRGDLLFQIKEYRRLCTVSKYNCGGVVGRFLNKYKNSGKIDILTILTHKGHGQLAKMY